MDIVVQVVKSKRWEELVSFSLSETVFIGIRICRTRWKNSRVFYGTSGPRKNFFRNFASVNESDEKGDRVVGIMCAIIRLKCRIVMSECGEGACGIVGSNFEISLSEILISRRFTESVSKFREVKHASNFMPSGKKSVARRSYHCASVNTHREKRVKILFLIFPWSISCLSCHMRYLARM